jgi:hypothetical protein
MIEPIRTFVESAFTMNHCSFIVCHIQVTEKPAVSKITLKSTVNPMKHWAMIFAKKVTLTKH